MVHCVQSPLPKFMCIELVMPSNYLILCRLLLPLPSVFPSIRVFSNESYGGAGGLVAKLCLTLVGPGTIALQAPLSMGFSGKNTRVDCHFLLQGIFPTQESNLGLLQCRQILYHLRHRGSRKCHAAKSLQSCPTLCDPIDGSPPGSPVPGILQARTLEWVAISFSNA